MLLLDNSGGEAGRVAVTDTSHLEVTWKTNCFNHEFAWMGFS